MTPFSNRIFFLLVTLILVALLTLLSSKTSDKQDFSREQFCADAGNRTKGKRSVSSSKLLSLVSDDNSVVNEKRAFLLETSGRAFLNARQTCSLESLALNNPNLSIYVLLIADGASKKPSKITYLESILSSYSNVKREVIELDSYLIDTPLEKWYYCSNWTLGPYKTVHLSDALRALTVWKYGGYYFDLDFIHIKPITSYENFIALEDSQQVGNSAFHSKKKSLLLKQVLEEIDQTYRADLWAHNGPGSFTRVLKRVCNTTSLQKLNYITCSGFNVFPYSSFYPIYHSHCYELFNMSPGYNVTQAAWINEVTLGIHFWNKITADIPVKKNSSQLYLQLAQKHCPVTLALAPDVF